MNFLSHADLGYDSKNLVRIEIPISNQVTNSAIFKNELANKPNIISVVARNGGGVLRGRKLMENK
jgi:hypothetical protein